MSLTSSTLQSFKMSFETHRRQVPNEIFCINHSTRENDTKLDVYISTLVNWVKWSFLSQNRRRSPSFFQISNSVWCVLNYKISDFYFSWATFSPTLFFTDPINFNDHHIIEPKIIHARHKRSIENTLEEVRHRMTIDKRRIYFYIKFPIFFFSHFNRMVFTRLKFILYMNTIRKMWY